MALVTYLSKLCLRVYFWFSKARTRDGRLILPYVFYRICSRKLCLSNLSSFYCCCCAVAGDICVYIYLYVYWKCNRGVEEGKSFIISCAEKSTLRSLILFFLIHYTKEKKPKQGRPSPMWLTRMEPFIPGSGHGGDQCTPNPSW